MGLIGRMKQWREEQRARAGGMVELLTWVPAREADFLKRIFARLADTSERGNNYRLVVSGWLKRRRAPLRKLEGLSFSAEIDLPFLGPWWFRKPAGGRITGSGDTWIELNPNEASEIDMLCRQVVSTALEEWLRQKGMIGALRDDVGVALEPDFAQDNYHQREGEIVIRPSSDEEFEKNEANIARKVEREALVSRQHQNDDPTVVYYDGFNNFPSRCHAIHRRVEGRILFALVHIPHGGTSPTNMIQELTVEMWKRFYPSDAFKKIEWFDCFVIRSLGETEPRIHQVGLTEERWHWLKADNLPEDFVEEIRSAARMITGLF